MVWACVLSSCTCVVVTVAHNYTGLAPCATSLINVTNTQAK